MTDRGLNLFVPLKEAVVQYIVAQRYNEGNISDEGPWGRTWQVSKNDLLQAALSG